MFSTDALKIARDCGYGLYHIDLLLVRARLHLLRGDAGAALDDIEVALDTGIRANEETGQVELLAANDDECGYAWAIPAGLQLRAEALLLQAAQQLAADSFVPAKSYELPAGVATLIDQAEQLLREALDLWQPLHDPEPERDDQNFQLDGKEYNYKAAETHLVLVNLGDGVLTQYPLRAWAGLFDSDTNEEWNMLLPEPPEWISEFAWKVHLLLDEHSLARFRDMLMDWKRDRDQSYEDHPRQYVGDDRSIDGPPPLFLGPKLTIPTRYTALAAIHDWCLSELEERCGQTLEPIDPWRDETSENMLNGIAYTVLRLDRLPKLDPDKHSELLTNSLSTVEQDLAQYRRTATNQTPPDAKATKMSKKHVFLSYCRDNKSEVSKLRDDLMAAGESVWWDQDILPGQNWKFEINKAMKDAYAVVLCFSAETEARSTTGIYPEARDAIGAYRQYSPDNIFLIPVRLSDCQLPPFPIDSVTNLDSLQFVDLFPLTERANNLIKLVQALQATPLHP